MKFNNKFVFSLATATGVIFNNNQIVKADILENLKHANEICATLKENPDAWMDAAQSFINAFDEFNEELNDVLYSEGAVPLVGTPIHVEIWGKGRTFPKNFTGNSFVQAETLAELHACGPYGWHAACCDTENRTAMGCAMPWVLTVANCCLVFPWINFLGVDQDALGVYYMKDHVEPILKSHIFRALKVDSLQAASAFWKRNFVVPVSQLLLDHSAEMKTDDRALQILLDLYNRYHRCDAIAMTGLSGHSGDGVFTEEEPRYIRLANFQQVYRVFYDELVDTILTWHTPGEGENILCGLLLERSESTKIGSQYYLGTACYSISDIKLISTLNKRLAVSGAQTVNASIARAVGIAQQRYQQKQSGIWVKL
ncbi:MAG: hypothetical protein ACSW8C_03890 [bacterium]